MIARIRAGSTTTGSLSAMGLCLATASSILGSVTVRPGAAAGVKPDASHAGTASTTDPWFQVRQNGMKPQFQSVLAT